MNVTPLIDVSWFARHLHGHPPVSQKGVDITCRLKRRATDITADVSQIMIEYTADKQISVNKQDTTMALLEDRFRKSSNSETTRRCSSWAPARSVTVTSSRSSTPPGAPVSKRSASSPTA